MNRVDIKNNVLFKSLHQLFQRLLFTLVLLNSLLLFFDSFKAGIANTMSSLTLKTRGSASVVRVYRSQLLTTKVDPRTVRIFLMAVTP